MDQYIDVNVRPEGGNVYLSVIISGKEEWEFNYTTDYDSFIFFSEDAISGKIDLGKPKDIISSVHNAWARFALLGERNKTVSISMKWTQMVNGSEIVIYEHPPQNIELTDQEPYQSLYSTIYFWRYSQPFA